MSSEPFRDRLKPCLYHSILLACDVVVAHPPRPRPDLPTDQRNPQTTRMRACRDVSRVKSTLPSANVRHLEGGTLLDALCAAHTTDGKPTPRPPPSCALTMLARRRAHPELPKPLPCTHNLSRERGHPQRGEPRVREEPLPSMAMAILARGFFFICPRGACRT